MFLHPHFRWAAETSLMASFVCAVISQQTIFVHFDAMYSQRIEVNGQKRKGERHERPAETRAGAAPRYRSLERAVLDWKPLGGHARSDWNSPFSIPHCAAGALLADVNKTCTPTSPLGSAPRFIRPKATVSASSGPGGRDATYF